MKTDRQLHDYISHRLETGLAFARWAQESRDRGHWASKATFEMGACRAGAEAAKLLPWLSANRTERSALEFKYQQLRRELSVLNAGAVMCA